MSGEVRPEWEPDELRRALLRYAAGANEITVEEAVRALILDVAQRWPEFVETAGVIDRATEDPTENRETRFPQATGGSFQAEE